MAKGEDPRCAELRKSLERIEEQISGAKLKLEAEAEKVQRYQVKICVSLHVIALLLCLCRLKISDVNTITFH